MNYNSESKRCTDVPSLVEQLEEEKEATKAGKNFQHIFKGLLKAGVMIQKPIHNFLSPIQFFRQSFTEA